MIIYTNLAEIDNLTEVDKYLDYELSNDHYFMNWLLIIIFYNVKTEIKLLYIQIWVN